EEEIYGENWLNIYLYKPGEFKVLLDGIFAIDFGDLFVEPYQTRTIARVWQPVGLLTRQPEDAAVFQLFGHMHKRGDSFQIDVVRGGHCSGNPAWACGRDDDCRCWFPQRTRSGTCQAGQTCVRDPGAEDSTIYYTDAWDRAPVMNFQPPYLLVNHDQGLRWTCTHTNGIQGDPAHPPKTCKEGCNACGWTRRRARASSPRAPRWASSPARRPTRRASPCRSSSARRPTTTCATCSATSSPSPPPPRCPEVAYPVDH